MSRHRVLALLLIASGILANPSSRVLAQTPAQRSGPELPQLVVQSNHAADIKALVASPTGDLVASGSADGTVKLWSPTSGLLLQTISVSPSWVRALAFSGDGRRLAAGTGDHNIYLYDIPSGTLLRTLRGANSAIVAMDFTGDGWFLAASTTRDKTLYIWRTDGDRVYATIPTSMPVRALRFLSDL
ncbi:MAG TPA: hypothetical protein VFO31_17235, partial [Vicinamibacterales bacterium]|nr:hypothetical protein [Vicinamibacterales bacterium]